MTVVMMAAVIVVVVVVDRGLVWAATTIELVVLVEALFIDVLDGVVIALDFAARASYFGDGPSGIVVGALTGEVADVVMGFVTGIRVEVLADANVSLVTDLEFNVPKPL